MRSATSKPRSPAPTVGSDSGSETPLDEESNTSGQGCCQTRGNQPLVSVNARSADSRAVHSTPDAFLDLAPQVASIARRLPVFLGESEAIMTADRITAMLYRLTRGEISRRAFMRTAVQNVTDALPTAERRWLALQRTPRSSKSV